MTVPLTLSAEYLQRRAYMRMNADGILRFEYFLQTHSYDDDKYMIDDECPIHGQR